MARRLTTLLAADVAGWSRLVRLDEEAAIAAHRGHRAVLVDPLFRRHGGRLANTAGDSLLIEFPSAVAAVACALAWRDGVAERNAGEPHDRRVEYRIGLHIGDVIEDGEDLLGDGVNLAARIEALAPPGGVWASRAVAEAAAGKGDFSFAPMGARRVKNIDAPVEVFEVRAGAAPAAAPPVRRARLFAGAAFVSVAVSAAAAWLLLSPDLDPFPPPMTEAASEAAMALPLPDRPSLAILPFRDLSDGAGARFFADGLTEDLITDLSRVSGLFVIARNTSFAYRGASPGPKAVAEALGVRHVLEGSVRGLGGRLRVNAQLVDALSGEAVWAERFDGGEDEVFELQDRIALRIVEALVPALIEGERDRMTAQGPNTASLDAKAAFQTGWDHFSRFNAEDNAAAAPHFRRAVELDPEFGRAWGALALTYMRGAVFGWSGPLGVQEATLYRELAPQALAEARALGSALAPVVEAMRRLNYRHGPEPEGRNRGVDDARREAALAISLAPSDPEGHLMMAWALIAGGEPREGLSLVEAARRLDPRAPGSHVLFAAAAHFALGELKAAADLLEARLAEDPKAWELAPLAAAVQARLGRRAAAPETLRRWRPELTEAGRRAALERYLFPIRWTGEAARLNAELQDAMRLAAEPASTTVESLLERVATSGPDGQVDAIRRLGWFGPAAVPAIGALSAALYSVDRRVAREAAVTLGKIGPGAVASVPRLEALVDRPIIGFRAREALEKIRVQE